MLSKLLNKLWHLSLKRDFKDFHSQFSTSASIQQQKLLFYINKNKTSKYGIKFNFSEIKSYVDFKEKVPIISEYEKISSYINTIAKGDRNILFSDDILFFEETSGSSSASKLIPYTQDLKNEFNKAFAPWIHTMNKNYPGVFSGKAYWSLSPALKENRFSEAGIRIGIEDDTEYLTKTIKFLYGFIRAVNIKPNKFTSSDEFFIETWRQLINTKNLSLISIWSPSFLIQLFSVLKNNYAELKTNRLPEKFNEVNLKVLFPKCKVISCWTDSSASIWLNELEKIAGGIPIHSKGLLLTEGVVTTPFNKHNYLSYHSHFYEFLDRSGNCFRSHELKIGEKYTVLITTGGGLYRYNTHDIVKVVAITDSLPALEFMGRGNITSDLVGEKLALEHINQIVKKLHESNLIHYFFIQPQFKENQAYYSCYINYTEPSKINEIELIISKMLRENPYYLQAIKIGQLKKEVFIYKDKKFKEDLINKYSEFKKISLGNLKIGTMLDRKFSF